jgi:DNA-binding NarL/FixJ family response regulator
MPAMKVLMIDDHPLILAAMQNVVRGLGEQVRVVGVETVDEARNLLQGAHGFDLVLLDLFLGAHDSHDFLIELRAAHPQLPVVVVSASEDPADLERCIEAGAMGFVPKRASNDMLFEALLLVMSGGVFVPELFSGAVGLGVSPGGWPAAGTAALGSALSPTLTQESSGAQSVHEPVGPAYVADGERVAAREALISPTSLESLGLTPRQSQVLVLLLEGKPNKLIARELGLSVETIKDHVAAVLRCLGVSSRTQAVIAVRHQFSPASAGPR